MAFTRKFLSALGIEADKIEEIISAHAEVVDALKEERDKYKVDAEKLAPVQKELSELKEAAKDGGEYAKLKKQFDDYKAEVEREKAMAAKREALTIIAKDVGLTEEGVQKALKYADWDSIELDEKGNVKDANTVRKSLGEEWARYVETRSQKGANTPTPPQNQGKTGMTKEEIFARDERGRYKLSDKERQKAIAANLNLFQRG